MEMKKNISTVKDIVYILVILAAVFMWFSTTRVKADVTEQGFSDFKQTTYPKLKSQVDENVKSINSLENLYEPIPDKISEFRNDINENKQDITGNTTCNKVQENEQKNFAKRLESIEINTDKTLQLVIKLYESRNE